MEFPGGCDSTNCSLQSAVPLPRLGAANEAQVIEMKYVAPPTVDDEIHSKLDTAENLASASDRAVTHNGYCRKIFFTRQKSPEVVDFGPNDIEGLYLTFSRKLFSCVCSWNLFFQVIL